MLCRAGVEATTVPRTQTHAVPHEPGGGGSIDAHSERLPVTRRPEDSDSERYIALAIFVSSLLYLCLFRSYTWGDPDEGIILQGAQRILDGQVLYRDFFSFFTPGSYYLFALVFRVFGNSYVVAHTALAVIGAGYAL